LKYDTQCSISKQTAKPEIEEMRKPWIGIPSQYGIVLEKNGYSSASCSFKQNVMCSRMCQNP
jgi:hypothetical protein